MYMSSHSYGTYLLYGTPIASLITLTFMIVWSSNAEIVNLKARAREEKKEVNVINMSNPR